MLKLIGALPLMWQLAIGAAVLAAVTGGALAVHHHIYQSGWDDAIAAVAHQNQEAVDAVNQHRAVVRDCNDRPGMRWSQAARECVGRD